VIGSFGAGAAAFALMEPFTYAAHRWVMHGAGWAWHRVHHEPRRTRFDANDRFPVIFAAVTIAGMATGSRVRAWRVLLPVGAGVTAYGAAYAFVHDLYSHERLGRLPAWAPLEYLRQAHDLHHRYGGEPYGMLAPICSTRSAARRPESRTIGTPTPGTVPEPVSANP
jgi:beta-carotene 3-hydroxylase